ncbi:MAG: hypothetical protein IT207_07940 [Fimbriimonadaceae bacterium]|nr:hypothetical protein [Fimbriimonadaceae bacterium]
MAWRGVAWRGVAALYAFGASLAGAQPYGGDQFGGQGYIEFLDFLGQPGLVWDRVKELSASPLPSVAGPMGAPPTRQQADFKLKAVWEPAEDWGLAGFKWEYYWQPPGGPAIPADALTIIEGPFNQYATGRAAGPGIFWAKVGILRIPPGGQPETVPGVWLTAQCCAFGGPLQLGVAGSERQTWLQIGRTNSQPNGANNNPWYLQYFGYPPDQPVPAGFQQTQDATATIKYSQPEGVTWIWQPVAGTYSATLAGLPPNSPHPMTVDLQATGPFEDSEVKCYFYTDVELVDGFQCGTWAQSYPLGAFVTNGQDDTEQSHYQAGVFSGKQDSETKMVSKITAAEPGELTRIQYDAYDPGPPSKRCGRYVRCNLKDTIGRNMPGVLCQERFPEGLPDDGISNRNTGFVWHTLVGTGVSSPIGNWHATDNLWYRWPGPQFPTISFPQQYWVATENHATGGLLKRSLTIQLVPGEPGQCTQTGF